MATFDPDSEFDNAIEIVLDAFGNLNGVCYKGRFIPITSLFFWGCRLRIKSRFVDALILMSSKETWKGLGNVPFLEQDSFLFSATFPQSPKR